MNIPRQWILFVLFTFAYFLSYFFRSANAVIAGDLSQDLALTPADLGLMTSLFYATFALVQLPLGVALDRYGPRFVTSGLMLVGVVGSLIFAGAQSFAVLALGRALIGVGMAGVLMGALTAFGRWFPEHRLATVSGVLVGLGASGGLAAGTPLAWLSETVGWRAIFAWGALVILASSVLLMIGVRNYPPGTVRPPARGGINGLGQIFRDLRFWRIAPAAFCLLGTTQAVQTLWGGPYLFDVQGFSQLQAGNLLVALSLGVVVGYFASGWLADQFGRQRMIVVALVLSLVCQLAFVLPGVQLPLPLLYLIYIGLGFSGSFNIVQLAQVRSVFPPEMSGRAVTALNLFGFSGTALIQWWMGLIISLFAVDATGRYPAEAYAAAFGFTAVFTALSLVWFALPVRVPQERTAPTSSIVEEKR